MPIVSCESPSQYLNSHFIYYRNIRHERLSTSVSAATSTLQVAASQVQPLHMEDNGDTFQPQEVAHCNVEPEEEIEDVQAETEDQDIEERDNIPEEDHEEEQGRREDGEVDDILDSQTKRSVFCGSLCLLSISKMSIF